MSGASGLGTIGRFAVVAVVVVAQSGCRSVGIVAVRAGVVVASAVPHAAMITHVEGGAVKIIVATAVMGADGVIPS